MLSCFRHVKFSVTLWTVACQAPLSMGFSRQEGWIVMPSSRDLPNPRIKPKSPPLEADSLLLAPPIIYKCLFPRPGKCKKCI